VEAPSVEAARRQLDGTAHFVGVAWYGDDASFSAFAEKYDFTFPQISDDEGVVFERFGVPSQPATAVVRTDGSVVLLNGRFSEAAVTAALQPDGA
jgi:peroxiredoxin